MNSDAAHADAKIHQYSSIFYENPFNQLLMINHEIGIAIKNEKIRVLMKL